MPIKVNTKKRTVRETTAPYICEDAGELKTEQIRVRYYSFRWNELQDQHNKLRQLAKDDPQASIWPHETLVDRLESLPDLTDEKGKPFAITAHNLGSLDTQNLNAIKKAIDEDFTAGK